VGVNFGYIAFINVLLDIVHTVRNVLGKKRGKSMQGIVKFLTVAFSMKQKAG
jgi:hypothetical protein